MKKITMFVLALGLAVSVQDASAKGAGGAAKTFSREYGSAGCGLGSMVVGKGPGFSQVFAATTNDTVSNQFFGITFGTSNCVDSETAAFASRMDTFVTANRVALASDIARGGGETLASLSGLMNCANPDALHSSLQRNFGSIFPSESVEAMAITDSIITVVGNEQVGNCKI